jgi:hypothetical protein
MEQGDRALTALNALFVMTLQGNAPDRARTVGGMSRDKGQAVRFPKSPADAPNARQPLMAKRPPLARREMAYVLVAEQMFLTLLAVPLGWLFG